MDSETLSISGLLLALCAGIGLSAACGFRVFVPPLILGLAAKAGMVELSSGFQWIESWWAIALFGTAMVMEVMAYYVPGVDNLLDFIEVPAAIIAGTLLTFALIPGEFSAALRWVLSIIAGGGAAAVVEATTVATRAGTTMTTAGCGNGILSTLEFIGSLVVSVLTVFFAPLALLLVVFLLVWLVKKLVNFFSSTAENTVDEDIYDVPHARKVVTAPGNREG